MRKGKLLLGFIIQPRHIFHSDGSKYETKNEKKRKIYMTHQDTKQQQKGVCVCGGKKHSTWKWRWRRPHASANLICSACTETRNKWNWHRRAVEMLMQIMNAHIFYCDIITFRQLCPQESQKLRRIAFRRKFSVLYWYVELPSGLFFPYLWAKLFEIHQIRIFLAGETFQLMCNAIYMKFQF